MEGILAPAMIVLGLVVLALGSRLVILAAAVGALLGIVLLRFIPGAQSGWIGILIPVILAVVFAFGGGFVQGLVGIITLAVGAVGGAAIVLGLLDLFAVSFGAVDWALVIVGAVIGVMLVSRFRKWAMIGLAAVVGALLVTRGLQILVPSLQGSTGSVIGLVLGVVGFAYQGGFLGGRKQTAEF